MVYRVVSLFTGMGGLDIGFTEAIEWHTENGFIPLPPLPFSIVFQNDISKHAKWIAEKNKWLHNYYLGDIRGLLECVTFPDAEVVIGGFPCQDFSHAGKRLGFESDRGTLYRAFVEVIKKVRPSVFIAENVLGLLTMKGVMDQIIRDFSNVGYDVHYQVVQCEEIGIPQRRHRVIIIGCRTDVIPCDNWWEFNFPKKRVTVGTYLNDLHEPSETQDTAQKAYSRCRRLQKGQGQKAVRDDDVAPTIRAEHHGNIEFRRIGLNERRLTVRECAMLQTFPKHCILNDDRLQCTAYKPIGNAVPPLLGYRIAEHVLGMLNKM